MKQPENLGELPSLTQVTVPDLWQQEAVAALRAGGDVVVHAPTGAGKTLIFELWSNQGKNRGQAIYTVPTRALANDKLAEWRARGWDVGIATGDLAENLNAPILVATLETQKQRLIRGEGPTLLVVDEYQMLGDRDRGLNYELSIGLAPAETQLLLLSGSVANPREVVRWLERLGRRPTLIRHDERPVPLEEIHAEQLSFHVPTEIRGYWPRLVAKALAEDLGPVLLFAPRRQAAEAMAEELARQLPLPQPLQLSTAQKQVVGESLARLLRARVTYHHSGLSYAARAGVIEPLAKAGQLRAVVATMGLAAGINFSLRSVALAGDSYRRDTIEQPLAADEILQMFGRAGRRGLDETGYVLVTANEIRLLDAQPKQLARNGAADWGALLGVMATAHERGRDPYSEAARVQERLFTTKPIFLGVEESLRHPETPCGLRTDAERARLVRKRVKEILNSHGEWQHYPEHKETLVREVRIFSTPAIDAAPESQPAASSLPPPAANLPSRPALSHMLTNPAAMEKVGHGTLTIVAQGIHGPEYGRELTAADRLGADKVLLAKWVRRLTQWKGRQATLLVWRDIVAPLLERHLAAQRTPATSFVEESHRILVRISLGDQTVRVPVDAHGVALWRPPVREVLPQACSTCSLVSTCRELPTGTGVALLWRRMGLVDASGVPSRRGRLVSFFPAGDGLAIGAALEDESYPLDELMYDLADLDGGFRFCGEGNRWAGRLAQVCHERFGLQSVPGYLENGVPPRYGWGAEQVVAAVHKDPNAKHAWVTDLLGAGDIDRVIIEWRSLLRQMAHAPELDWPRWRALQAMARAILRETESPTVTELPPLEHSQLRRVDHRLALRRH